MMIIIIIHQIINLISSSHHADLFASLAAPAAVSIKAAGARTHVCQQHVFSETQ
jgi:hypothetical protein